MASQPEGEEEEDFPGYLAVSDDRQATVGYGGIEKPGEIVGVPPELDHVVDGAIHLLRMVEERVVDADFDTILEHMEMYMYLREPADSTLHLPDEVFDTLEGLVEEVTYHYNTILGHATAQDSNEIFNILRQYCQKVKDFQKGCLLARLCLEDDHQLGGLISNLSLVARQVREVIDAEWYLLIKSLPTRRGVSSDNQRKLLQSISRRLRLVIAVTKQEMINFLRDDIDADSISLTIMMCPPDKKSVSTDGGEEQFLDGFTDFEYTLKGLQEAFQTSAESKSAQEEKPLKLDISEGASQGAKDILGTTERKTYRGLLSPPPSSEKAEPQAEAVEMSDTTVYVPSLPSHTTTRNLFDCFKEYGVLLNVHLPIDRFFPGNNSGYGLVQFLKEEGAEKAIKDSKYNASMARKNTKGSALEESKIIIQDLLGLTTNVELVEMCKGYGTIEEAYVIPQKQLGFVKFTTRDEALKALDGLQSRNIFALMARPKKLLTGVRRMF